jgi:hypothetical protein
MGSWRGVERGVAGFKVHNTRSWVRLKLQHLSLRWRVVRPRMWMLQIRWGQIISWDMVPFLDLIPWSPLKKFWQTPNVPSWLEFPVENSVAVEFWSCNGVFKSFHLYQFRNKMIYWKHKSPEFWDYWKICTGV